jgi:1,4-dihydroxy-6-naphthoate synthase
VELTVGHAGSLPDAAAFYAWDTGRVAGPRPNVVLASLSTTNAGVRACHYDVARVSVGLLPYLPDEYVMLAAGATVGRRCGPIMVTRTADPDLDAVRTGRIAGADDLLTSCLLARLWAQPHTPTMVTPLPAREIFGRVRLGTADAGVVAAEARFLFGEELHAALDLGDWWERETGLPVPLCVTVARRSVDVEAVTAALSESVRWSLDQRDEVLEHLRRTVPSRPDVLERHFAMYPNAAPPLLDDEGYLAVETLLRRAADCGLAPPPPTLR